MLFSSVPVNPPSLLPCLPRNIKPTSSENDDETETDATVTSAPEGGTNEQSDQNAVDDKTDNQTIMRLLEDGEKVQACLHSSDALQYCNYVT